MKFILKHFGKVIAETLLTEGQEYFIGRQEDCDFVLEESTIVSRKHVKIYQSPETENWIVEVLSEVGGLYFEGEEVESLELEQSCILNLKNYSLEFVKEGAENLEKEEKEEESEKELDEGDENLGSSLNANADTMAGSFSSQTQILSDSQLIHSLHVYIAGEFSDHISLNEGENWIIGRSGDCDVSIDYSVLTRKHLQISKKAEKFYVKDLGSSNKTFLNDKELVPGQMELLRANDEISVSDLKIVFEVRNKNHDNMMSNLPALDTSEGSDSGDYLPELAMPKVILEDVPEESKSSEAAFMNKKKIFIFAGVAVLAVIFYLQYEDNETKKKQQAELQKSKDQKDKLKVFYSEAVSNQEQQRYQLCIDQIEEIHTLSPAGYGDSQQILLQCQNALKNQRQKEEYLAQEKNQKETEVKINAIVEDCKKKFAEDQIQTEEDLNQCASDLLAGLDPANPDISSIRLQIQDKANLEAMEEKKKEDYRKNIQAKRSLYNKAKRLAASNKKPLKAVAAYNVFLRSAKGVPALKKLYAQAVKERDGIQSGYDEELNGLHQSCEKLINENKMKEAYYDCRRILSFKSDDQKAKEYMKRAVSSLKNQLKPLYEKSMQDESFSRVEEALKSWNEIVEKDIQGGHYYEKARSQIKKYK